MDRLQGCRLFAEQELNGLPDAETEIYVGK